MLFFKYMNLPSVPECLYTSPEWMLICGTHCGIVPSTKHTSASDTAFAMLCWILLDKDMKTKLCVCHTLCKFCFVPGLNL